VLWTCCFLSSPHHVALVRSPNTGVAVMRISWNGVSLVVVLIGAGVGLLMAVPDQSEIAAGLIGAGLGFVARFGAVGSLP
jgi:hypothetical protein